MTSYAAQFVLDEEYRCGYCCLLKKDLEDPRILPCKHVFCHSCINSNYRHGLTLECPVCRVGHNDLIIKDLPTYTKEKEISCSVCGLIAELCCNQCNIYMCKEHAKEHDETFSSSSKFSKHEKALPLGDRTNACPKNKGQFCAEHSKEEVRRACSTCFKPLCIECTVSGKCSIDKSHLAEKIETLSEKLKNELFKIMADLHVKSTVMSDLEKEANVILAEQENTLDQMKALVDKVTEEQMNEIQEKAKKLKSAIDEVLKASTESVKHYVAELMAVKDASDSVRKDIHNLITCKPDIDIIKDYKQAVKRSDNISKTVSMELSLPFIEIQQIAKQREVEIAISPICQKIVIQSPQTFGSGNEVKEIMENKHLIHVSSSATGRVYSVNWLSTQELACGSDGKLEIRDQALNFLKSHAITGDVACICLYGTDYIILVYDNSWKVNLYSSEFSYKRTILNGCSGDQMAVKGGRILVIDDSSQNVKLYTTDGALLLDVNCQPHIKCAWGLQFQDENSFLVSDYDGGKVLKFTLEANSRPEWICKGLQDPTGIATDTSGLIYVASNTSKTIYLLTPSGELLQQISLPKLYPYLRSISISGSVLAVGSDRGVQLFSVLSPI